MQPRVLILASALDSSPRSVALDRPMTVAEVIAIERVPLELPTIAVMTDPAGKSVPVMRGEWHVRQVTPGYQLAFVPVPAGGGLRSILSAVASIALAVFAPWAAGALAGMMGLTGTAATIATSLIGAGIMIAGQFILSRLMPPPSPAAQAETVYTARASNNRAMPLEPIPELYGRLRYPPPFAARPYAEFADNDQFLYQLHCMSVGHVDVQRWEIGDTLVWTREGGFAGSFAGGDTEIEIVRPGEEVTLFPANVVTAPTVDGQQVPDAPAWLGPFAVSAPGIEVERIACDYAFPLGLTHIDKKGRAGTVARTVTAQYQAIDNAGNGVGPWLELFSVQHRAATRTPQRFTRGNDVPPGRYQVRFGASGSDESDNTGRTATLNRVMWAGLRGYVGGFETPADCTLVATKIRATEHLSREASGQYLFTGQRLLPVWSAVNGWSAPVPTRSPAWAAADLLRKLGVADHEYDLGRLASYAALWEGRGDRFDAIFDRRWQAAEALDAILRVGRAYHVRLGSIIGFVRDEPRLVRRMAFTPDVVVRGSIRREDIWFSEESPDHLEVVYLDGESWQERSVMAAIGAIGHDKPQQEPAFGITDHDHAWREGIFKAAENAYRRSFRTFQTEREGRMLVRGDPVVLHDPLMEPVFLDDPDGLERQALFARLEERAGDVLTLDRPIETAPGETYHVLIRDKLGREWGPCLVGSIDGATVTLDAGDRTVVEAQHGALTQLLPDTARSEPTHVSILVGDYRLFDGLVVEAKPVGSDLWEVTLVNDDQRVHAVDQTEAKPSPWTPPALLAPVPGAPVVRGVHAVIQRGTLSLMIEAGWQPAIAADRYVAELSYDEDAATDPGAASWSPVHDSRATRLSVPVMPQPATLRVAGIGRLQGEWAYAVASAVPDLFLPDEVVDPLMGEFRELLDWSREDSPIHGLGETIAQETRDRVDQIAAEQEARLVETASLAARWRDLSETVGRLSLGVFEVGLAQKREFTLVREELVSVDERARTFVLDQIELAVGEGSANAARLTAIEAQAQANFSALEASIDTVQQSSANALAGEAQARIAQRIQMVGEYTGNDISQVTQGLLAQIQRGWISETEALAEQMGLLSVNVGNASLFNQIIGWSFSDDVEGWTGNGAPSIVNGWLTPADHATDPYLVSPAGLGVQGSRYQQIRLYVRLLGSALWNGYLWWKAVGDTTWSASRRVEVAEPVFIDGAAAVTVNVDWVGIIDQIRLDLTDMQAPGQGVQIKNFYVGEPAAGYSQAQALALENAFASQVLAEVQKREALSTILTGMADPAGATLPSLTEGLFFDEVAARSAADAANAQAIQGVAARIEDDETGLDALAQAQSTMRADLTNLDGLVSGHTSSIADLVLGVGNLEQRKADIAITEGIRADIEQMGGSDAIVSMAQATRTLQNTVARLAEAGAGTMLAGKRDRTEVESIVAKVHQEANSRIDATDDSLTLLGRIVDQVGLDLAGKAGLDITAALDGRITETADKLTVAGADIASLKAVLNGYDGQDAVADAFQGMSATITAVQGNIDDLSNQLDVQTDFVTALNATVGNISGSNLWKMEVVAGSGDVSVRGVIMMRASIGSDWVEVGTAWEAGFEGGNPTKPFSRQVLIADKIMFVDALGNLRALFDEDGLTMENIRIGTLKFNQLESDNGKLVIRGKGNDSFFRVRS